MIPIQKVLGQELTWTQPRAMKREYLLRAGKNEVAKLRWVKLFGSLAEGQTADGCWTFKRGGFLRPKVTVRLPGSDQDYATVEARWSGNAVIRFASGAMFHWDRTSFWSGSWALSVAKGEELVQFTPKFTLFKRVVKVSVHPRAATTSELPVLLLLGCYLLILMLDDQASAAGAS